MRAIAMLLLSTLVACSSGGTQTTAPYAPGAGGADGGGSGGPAGGGGDGGVGGSATYAIDLSQTSVSGLSSGAFMAVQFQVAFSSIMKGAAIFAGGPYGCSQGQLTTALTSCASATTAPDVTPLVTLTNQNAAAGDIDPTSNLASQNVFLFGGADDHTVAPVVMDALQTYYSKFIDASHITYESRHAGAGHTMPTVSYGGSCDLSMSPWIGACNYDGAGKALAAIYGTLAPASTSPEGSIVELPQGDYISNPASHSLADKGYAYVPKTCAAGETCRIHVAFHGCAQQASGAVGSAFYENAGYNPWADTNHLIVIYPQTTTSTSNPNACWDWWGYDSPDYAKKAGPQMAMVRAMIAHFAGK